MQHTKGIHSSPFGGSFIIITIDTLTRKVLQMFQQNVDNKNLMNIFRVQFPTPWVKVNILCKIVTKGSLQLLSQK